MKKYQVVINETFNAFQTVRGGEITDFTIHAIATKPMHITVWLDHNEHTEVAQTSIVLGEGTTWEISAKIAKWLNTINFDAIREAFEKWKDLDSNMGH